MLLLKKELILCLAARGYDAAPGFMDEVAPLTQQEQSGIRERLIGHKLLEETDTAESGYRFSALGQVILDTVGAPDAWLEVRNEMAAVHRRIYLRDAFYVCMEEDHEMLLVSILPSLPLVIGGYASALKGVSGDAPLTEQLQPLWENSQQVIRLRAHCDQQELLMEIADSGVVRTTVAGAADFSPFTRESCTNTVTMWLLNTLKERGNR